MSKRFGVDPSNMNILNGGDATSVDIVLPSIILEVAACELRCSVDEVMKNYSMKVTGVNDLSFVAKSK